MRVTRSDVARLRARLHRQDLRVLLLSLVPRKLVLEEAAFTLAVHARFADGTREDVAKFAEHAVSRYGSDGPGAIDPDSCEQVILAKLTGAFANLSAWQVGKHMVVLLAQLIEDENLTDGELEEFIAKAIHLATVWRKRTVLVAGEPKPSNASDD